MVCFVRGVQFETNISKKNAIDRLHKECLFFTLIHVISSETMNVDMFIAKNLAAGEYEAGLSLGQQIKNNKSSGDPNNLFVYDVVQSGLGSEGSSLNHGNGSRSSFFTATMKFSQ